MSGLFGPTVAKTEYSFIRLVGKVENFGLDQVLSGAADPAGAE